VKKVVEQRKDVVFYKKMFPLMGLHPQAYDKAKTILCQDSNEKSLELLEQVYAKKEIPKPTCETDAVDKNLKLGEELGVSSTPTMIFPDGRMVGGAMPAEAIIQQLGPAQ
jgi:thiol:disulfide interchange protein DsbC